MEEVNTGFEITKKNHCDGDIFEHIVSGFKARNYAQEYIRQKDFSSLF